MRRPVLESLKRVVYILVASVGGGRMSLVNLKVVAAVYLTGFTLMREMVMAVAQSHYLPGG